MSRLKLGRTTLLITGILCLVTLLRINIQDKDQDVISASQQQWNQQIEAVEFQPFPRLPPKCTQNSSTANITGFSSLPSHIQDFLFYRHCRHFPMLLNVPDKCGVPHKSGDVFLLLVIKSFPSNYKRRAVLRKTWAVERLQNGVWIRTVFISGTAGQSFEKLRLNKLLEVEHIEHQDILQWDFHDSHFNLSLKQILFLEWMEKWCPNVQFLFNGDDDIFANTDNIVEFLLGLDDNDGRKHLFVGNVMQNFEPARDVKSKFYIPVQVYESDTYPLFCSGAGILISHFTARTIYNMSHSIPIMPLDDVYIGVCLEKAGLKPSSHSGVLPFGLPLPSLEIDPYHPCFYRDIILVHGFLPHEIYVTWHKVHRQDLRCEKMLASL